MTPPQLDLTTAVTALAAIIFGPHVAAYVGPYAAILIGASVGTGWSLGRRAPGARYGAFQYFVLVTTTALVFTVPLSEWLGQHLGHADSRWLFSPVAMLIGGIGGDWPELVKWVGMRTVRFFERRAGVEDDKP